MSVDSIAPNRTGIQDTKIPASEARLGARMEQMSLGPLSKKHLYLRKKVSKPYSLPYHAAYVGGTSLTTTCLSVWMCGRVKNNTLARFAKPFVAVSALTGLMVGNALHTDYQLGRWNYEDESDI